MAEKLFFNLLGRDKTVINPLNHTEIFNCSDINDDFRRCKVISRKGHKSISDCLYLKYLSRECYFKDEREFKVSLAKRLDKKKNYLLYLKDNDSLLYNIYLNDSKTFSLINHTNEFFKLEGKPIYDDFMEDELAKEYNSKILFKK